jgi:NAD(P)-dependent dehydrogenase (short-subunit alcohol dehydrogenase family)
MGSVWSSNEYNPGEHGVTSRTLFDEYLSPGPNDAFADLTGKVVAITGTSAGGIGYYIAEVAIRKGCKVLLLCNRNSSSAQKGTTDLQTLAKEYRATTEIIPITMDLQDFSSVQTAAEEINTIASKHQGLDVLVCNAGVMALKDVRTQDGFDVQMQTNQLSHFLLTAKVWKSLVAAAHSRGNVRVVTHSSSARHSPGANLEQSYFTKCPAGTLGGDTTWTISQFLGWPGPWMRYHQTKLANACFAMALHDKLSATSSLKDKIQASSADPGLASSNLQATSAIDGTMPHWMAKVLMPNGQSAADGALPICMAAFGKTTVSGSFFQPQARTKGPPVTTITNGVPVQKKGEPLVTSTANKENVWKWCEQA